MGRKNVWLGMVVGASVANYNAALNELSFSLTLNQAITFSSASTTETLAAGSVFSASDVSVSAPSGGVVTGTGTGAATLYASSSSSAIIDPSVAIAALSCTVGAGQCGVTFGTTGLSLGTIGGEAYEGNLTFNVNVTPVPLPAAGWLMLTSLSGLASFMRLGRNRTAAA
jgi:hypothetical protein